MLFARYTTIISKYTKSLTHVYTHRFIQQKTNIYFFRVSCRLPRNICLFISDVYVRSTRAKQQKLRKIVIYVRTNEKLKECKTITTVRTVKNNIFFREALSDQLLACFSLNGLYSTKLLSLVAPQSYTRRRLPSPHITCCRFIVVCGVKLPSVGYLSVRLSVCRGRSHSGDRYLHKRNCTLKIKYGVGVSVCVCNRYTRVCLVSGRFVVAYTMLRRSFGKI